MATKRFSAAYLQASSWLQQQVPYLQSERETSTTDFAWDSVKAYEHFEWQPCFRDFKCARLQVPMDWQGTTNEANKTVEIAVIKVEATVPVTDATYGGAVIFNPGGPGGSGIGQILRGGFDYRTLLSAGPGDSPDTARNFDILGFDPRGVNNTRPMVTCFPDQHASAAWDIEAAAHGYMGSSDTSFDYVWASRSALARGCAKRLSEEGIAKHVSTAAVARDIVEISERHGEWREAEAERLIKSATKPVLVDRTWTQPHGFSDIDKHYIRKRTGYVAGQEKIQYWGFSYGTILGATLAAMYPKRIKRAVLDGVADSHDYMAGGWETNLVDTDLTFVKLMEYCYEGGKDNCAIWHEDGPAFIGDEVQRTIKDLRSNPIGITGNASRGPQVATFNDFQAYIRNIVYDPLPSFPKTAKILHELSQGNGNTLAAWKFEQLPKGLGRPLSDQCKEDGPYSPSCFTAPGGMVWDATYAIVCTDGEPRINQTKEQYRQYADKVASQSQLIGQSWAAIQLPCTAWDVRPAWRYEGDFVNKTAHPIMFAGNTIDPVTPLRNAFTMAKGFEGAAVLHQNSEGHCTTASVSMCSGRAIRAYFQNGTMPSGKMHHGVPTMLCEPDRSPFDGYEKGIRPPAPEGETDVALWNALVGLNQS